MPAWRFRDVKKKTLRKSEAFFVIPLGLEPKTHSLEGCCSIQLSYGTRVSDRKDKQKILIFAV